jgi:anti-sigma regulatory factor (Ser/Thr protein kinase)
MYPALDSDLSYSEVSYQTNRGYLARKIAQYLRGNKEGNDQLFYLSLSKKQSFPPVYNSESEMILYLSEQMLKWNQYRLDIPKQIMELEISNNIQNALLKAYEMNKKDLFSASSSDLKEDPKDSSSITRDDWKIYRDVIFAATQGRFLLIEDDELTENTNGKVFCEGTIQERSDIPVCRNQAKEGLEALGLNKSKIMNCLLVLSEAITNTIKHAEEGKMTLIESEINHEIRFIIEDNGPGFPLEDLPKATLLAGYSTKKSMGQGFTLMMKMTKQILLCTSPKGSTIILVFDSMKEKEGEIHATG